MYVTCNNVSCYNNLSMDLISNGLTLLSAFIAFIENILYVEYGKK